MSARVRSTCALPLTRHSRSTVALGARATCAHTSRRSFKMLDSGGANWEQTAVLRPSNAKEADGSQYALRPKPPGGRSSAPSLASALSAGLAAIPAPFSVSGTPARHCAEVGHRWKQRALRPTGWDGVRLQVRHAHQCVERAVRVAFADWRADVTLGTTRRNPSCARGCRR
jgi:hypothetical protein